MSTDYKVRFRSYAKVAEIAVNARKKLGIGTYYTFNIVKILRGLVGEEFQSLGALKLDIFDEERDRIAYVTFAPLTLHVHREVWELADWGEPKSRFILAHELGHILMHGHYLQAFSEDEKARLKFVQPEESAETQANWFAECFLAPDHLARSCKDESELCQQFDFPCDYAPTRLDDLKRNAPKLSVVTCSECGILTNLRSDGRTICETCELSKTN